MNELIAPGRFPDEPNPEVRARLQAAYEQGYGQAYPMGRLFGLAIRKDLENEAMQAQVRLDPLTGLLNRRGLEEEFCRIQPTALRHPQQRVVACYIDLDHFKDVNDSYGHDVGDKLLQEVAEVLHERLRVNDIYGRLGGEEFLALLPRTSKEAACQVAEDLTQGVREIQIDGLDLRPTVSIGVADANLKFDDLSAAVLRADQAMYRAKKLGRDRVEVL